MKIKSNYLKYIAVLLVIIFLITAILLFIEIWEKSQDEFPVSGTENNIIIYQDKEYVLKDNIESFLVLGLDKYESSTSADSHESSIQTDFLMLFVFDNDKKQCSALQISRDTMTQINRLSVGGTHVVDTYTKQIALAYNYVADDNEKIRCRNTKDSVEYLLQDVKIDHYLSLTMDAVPLLNDSVGGVEITVLDDFTGIDDTLVKGETVVLNGEQALRYVRARQGLEDSTNDARMARQRQYVRALYEKMLSCQHSDEDFMVQTVTSLSDYLVYDSSDQKMKELAEKFDEYEFLGIREIEGETKLGEEFMEFYPDEDSLKAIVVELFYTTVNE